MSSDYTKNLESLPEFDNHYSVFFLNDKENYLKGFIAIHRKNPKFPSFGATRLWKYETEIEALRDALRLSKMMSYKSALAGLESGGAKGVIILPKEKKIDRKSILRGYAKQVDLLKGNFITGTDVGLDQSDLLTLKKITPYIVGFNGYTTELTVKGIYYAIEVALERRFGSDRMEDRTFAIQGVGKVGEALLSLLAPRAKKIFIADIDKNVLTKVKKKYRKAVVVSPSKIHEQVVDVFCPCALSGSITSKNISELRCSIIVGGANNQLEDDTLGTLLHRLNILYAPDYIVNAGGLIAVVNEHENPRFSYESVNQKVLGIKDRLRKIFDASVKENKATNLIANELAVKIFNNYK